MSLESAAVSNPVSALEQLKAHFAEILDLYGTQGLLGWDLETYMPKSGSALRANQLATLSKISHQLETSPQIGDWLEELEAQKDRLSGIDRAFIRQVRREYDRKVKIPESLVTEMVRVTAEAHHIWLDAREQKSFKVFAPCLEKIVGLNRQMAEAVGYQGSPYNALLDDYEPDLTVDELEPVFQTLKHALVPLIQKIKSKPLPEIAFLHRQYTQDKQLAFSEEVLKAMGFDFDAGRLDLSVHPFSSGAGITDVRLTTRVNENDLFSALSSSMHEGGHGLYEQGISPEFERTPLAHGTSLGIHESQSRL